MEEYLVPTGFGEDEFIEKKSRFIGRVWPVETEEEAIQKIQEMKRQHYDATHNCWAYVIRGGAVRFSDDGEPGGTAGMPMLQVLQREQLNNLVCVVTRYFGGVLLGAGGLVRAYSHGCAIALSAAQVVMMEESRRVLIDVPYPLWDKVNHALKALPQITEDPSFGASVEATVLIREKDLDTVLATLTALTDAKIDLLPLDALHYPWPVPETDE